MRKRFGQHFLRDRAVIDRIIDAVAPAAGQTIIEIGPGDGALTAALIDSGATVIAVEIDRDLSARLVERYGNRLSVVTADILNVDITTFGDSTIRIVGNLPYQISTPLLIKLAALGLHLCDLHVMVQKEVGLRLCAPTSAAEYGRLTVCVRLYMMTQHLLAVPASAFSPPPKVESVFLRLRPAARANHSPSVLDALLRAAFQHRRKTLKNGLATWSVDWSACPIDGGRRAQTLSPEDFIVLSSYAKPVNHGELSVEN